MTDAQKPRTVDVDGLPVGYHVRGSGPALVLLHGATGQPETSFATLIDHFAETRTVIVPGYSGSTLTPLPDGPLDAEALAEQMIGVVKAEATGPVDLFGISTGAAIGAVVAAKEPGLVSRAVLLGGFASYQTPWQRTVARTWLKLAELDANTFADYTMLHVLSDEFLDGLDAGARLRLRAGLSPSKGMIALVELVSKLDVTEHLQKIEAPTLVIGMKRDNLVPVRYAAEFRGHIRGSEYAEIDTGHAAATEAPELLQEIIEDFLKVA